MINSKTNKLIVLKVIIEGRLQDVWNTWVNPDDIIKWYSGHQDWYTSESENNLKAGKSFTYLMKSKGGNGYFSFKGTYTKIKALHTISYSMPDNRKVETSFFERNNKVIIIQKVELEDDNSTNSQTLWWRTILINFKKHVEN